MSEPKMISRAEAKALGLTRYFTGKPCPRGHIAERQVSGFSCLPCLYAAREAWGKKNPEKVSAAKRRCYEAKPDHYKAKSAAWQKANPERRKAYRQKTPPNQERRRDTERARRAANPEKYRVKVRNRRAQRRGAEGSFTLDDIARIEHHQRGQCAMCPAKLAVGNREIDHIRAISKGGSNWPSNLQLLCLPCNRSKSAKDPLQFSRERGLLL